MTALPLITIGGDRQSSDRLQVLATLLGGPSVDPMFRQQVIRVPLGHTVFRWDCLVADCERPRAGRGDLCSAHLRQWRALRQQGQVAKARFVAQAQPLPLAEWPEERVCRLCAQRPARNLALRLCGRHWLRWYRHRRATSSEHHDSADFQAWLAGEQRYAGYGGCAVTACPELAKSPLGLCVRHESRYACEGRPGGARLPAQWANRYDHRGLPTPVTRDDPAVFRRWCAATPPVYRPGQVNLLGLAPLVGAEIQWGLFAHTQGAHIRWELAWVQSLANFCREHHITSLTHLDLGDGSPLRRVTPRELPTIVGEMVEALQPIYLTPADTRELGVIRTDHFGVKFPGRSNRIDLTEITQRWLRNILWDHMADTLRGPRCPRSAGPLDNMHRATLELSAFLQIHAPGGGHDPAGLDAEHAHRFVADLRERERRALASLIAKGVHGSPSIITANRRRNILNYTRGLLRGALDSGEVDRIGLDRGFIVAMPSAGNIVRRSRSPFPDAVARALADPVNMDRMASVYDLGDRGLRDVWEAIILTGRRCSEILRLKLDCLGRYGGLPMLWHDQTKVGNYDAAIRIPERLHELLTERQRKTVTLFVARHNRQPTAPERARMALFPTNIRNPDGTRPLSYNWFHRAFRLWIDELDIGRWVPHQARHSLATSLLRHGATLTHIRRYLGQVSDRMAEHYVHLANSDLEEVLQQVWVAGPGAASPGELLTDNTTPMTRERAQALAIDLSRRSTPSDGGFCTFQPVVDGANCPWNLDCHNCDKFVLSGADLLYWRRKREQWRQLAEGAPDDATADYLHKYFEPTAKAIDGLERALAGLGLLDQAVALDLRKPQDYFHRVWSTAFPATELAAAATDIDHENDTNDEEACA
jgi:integrase